MASKPYANGDWDARCPLHQDKKRSARINFELNKWICFAGCGKGNLSGLLREMRKRDSEAVTKPSKRRQFGGTASLAEAQVERWHRALMADEVMLEKLWHLRDVRRETAERFHLGYDQSRQAFTIPIYDAEGALINARQYRPDAPSDRKIFWAVKKDPDAPVPLFPLRVLAESDAVVLTEGEMDAIVANQYGFPAVSGTAGAKHWHVYWSELFKGKTVYIVYDRDPTGEAGARQVAENLEPFASEIYIGRIPLKSKGADITDYFLSGKEREDFRDRVLKKAKPTQRRVTEPMQMDAIPVSVMDSFDSRNVGRAQKIEVLISGRSAEPFSLPKVVNSTCTMDAGPKCKLCPMLQRGGVYRYEVPPSSPALLAMMKASKTAQADALREHVKAVKCDRLRHEVLTYQTVEQLYVRPPWEEESGDFTPRRVNSVGKHNTMPSQVVEIVGTTWPDPKEQKNEFIAWEVQEAENAIDEFRVTPDIVARLKTFQTRGRQSALDKLSLIAQDAEQHVTRIYGRIDLHVAVSLVFHSVLSFPFQDKLERRGWLDALVIGDTRTGKSEVSQRLLEHYGLGQFVNCEAATFAGIVGGLQQMSDRQWAVTWGVVPMSDRRLVVLDEASGLSHEEIQKMSDVRSRGFIRLQKIQAEQAWARTRLLWLSNPRDESMERYTYGVQAIAPLVGNREDVARFDFAMALTQHDVEMDQIYQPPTNTDAEYTSDDAHLLVLWAWSRKPEHIEWEFGAEHDVFTVAEWLGKQYVSDPPLIQAANAHVKIARVAVAMAAATFSTDKTGEKLIVRKSHVHEAAWFLHSLYKKDTFGYHTLSERQRDTGERAARSMELSRRWLLENRMLVEFFQRTEGQFRREMIEQMLNLSREEANAIVNRLFTWGLVSPNGHAVKMNPALHQLLRDIEEGGR
jgi:MCM P-loop domain/Toprim-like